MAFEKLAGIRPAIELATVARNYKQSGGSREAWIQAFDDAPEALRSAGQQPVVGNDQPGCAGAPQPMPRLGQDESVQGDRIETAEMRQPITSADQWENAQEDRGVIVGAGEPIPGAGHAAAVKKDQILIAGAGNQITSGKAMGGVSERTKGILPPAREPSAAYIRAAAESRRATAKVMLELHKTSAGKLWGSVKPHEFDGMLRDGDMAWAIKEAYGPFSEKEKHMELREFLPDATFRKALSLAEVSHVR